MTRRWMASAALVAGIALLPACGSASDDSAAPGSTAPSTSAAPTTAPPTLASATVDTTSPGGRVCAYLDKQQSRVAAAKSPADAKTVLTIDLATFASQNPDLRTAISAQLDALTTKSCPATRSALLAKLGTDSLAKALALG